jgi:hypothetical protein
MHIEFYSENLKGKYYSEEVGVDGRMVLEWILGKCDANWIYVAQNRDQRQDLLNMVMKLRVP